VETFGKSPMRAVSRFIRAVSGMVSAENRIFYPLHMDVLCGKPNGNTVCN